MIGACAFLLCAGILSVGRRIERTLELLNWILVVRIIGSFLALALLFMPGATWLAAARQCWGRSCDRRVGEPVR